MFYKISNHLSRHPWHRHLFFLVLAIFATLINGYHFGTFDQVFHITYLKEFVKPDLFPGDPFLQLRLYHFSYFWFPFIPLLRLGILEISMFSMHILTVYGTIWMFWSLSNLLFGNTQVNFIVSLALIIPHLGFPGFQIIEFSLLNRTFVLPFLLGSIWLYLKNKKTLAFLLLGLMFNIHVIYAAFVLFMFTMNEILTLKFKNIGKLMLQITLLILAASPVLLWRAGTGNGVDLTLRPDMLKLASRGLLYTVYYPIGPFPHVIGSFLAGVGTVWGFILGYKITPESTKHQMMRNFIIAIGILISIGTLASYFLPITILLQMQILRAGTFMLYFSMLYLCNFVMYQIEHNFIGKGWAFLLVMSYIILVTPMFTILIWSLSKALKKARNNPAWLIFSVLAFQTLTIIISAKSGFWSPGLHIFGPDSPWRQMQEWAKDNTNVDAKFITPPHLFWHYVPDWRVFSERTTLVTIPEMMEIPFDPNFAESFLLRFNALVPGAIDSFDGNFIRTLRIAEQAFYTNSAKNFIELACEFSVDYLVVERAHPYPFEIVHQNQGFILYDLPTCQ